jgi:hypothetical protein
VIGWLVGNAFLSLLWAILSYVGVRLVVGDEFQAGDYLVVVVFGAFGWPFYMAAVRWASRYEGRRFRVCAVVLTVILALPFNVGSLFIMVPEIFAATLAYLVIGFTIPRAPRSGPATA